MSSVVHGAQVHHQFLLFVVIHSLKLVVDNGFKTMTMPIAQGLGIDDNTASLQASLAGVIIGIGAVVSADRRRSSRESGQGR